MLRNLSTNYVSRTIPISEYEVAFTHPRGGFSLTLAACVSIM